MTAVWRRPILIGGIGLSMGLWMLEGLHHSVTQFGEWIVLGLIAVAAVLWFKQTASQSSLSAPVPVPVNREMVENAIANVETAITHLEAEHQEGTHWREKLAQLKTECDRQQLSITLTGGQNTGKSRIRELLQPVISATCLETPGLFSADRDENADKAILTTVCTGDLAVFVTTGDLTDSEFQVLQQLTAVQQRTLLVWNKQDQYLPEEVPVVLQQLRSRTQGLFAATDVVAIAAAPNSIKVRKHQPDGTIQEWLEQPEPAIAPLTNRLTEILTTEASALVLATTKRKADQLKAEVREQLNAVRRDRALPIIEQYQWIAATAAFANPVPALDLLATGAITGQLIMDLGSVYQQKLDLSQAQTAAKTVGSLMLKLGFVELSTQTVTHLLKTNAVTYVAGGLAQGISAAYLTRVAGLSLIEYLQTQEPNEAQTFNFVRFGETLKKVFQDNQRTAFLQTFVKQALQRLIPENQPASSSSAGC